MIMENNIMKFFDYVMDLNAAYDSITEPNRFMIFFLLMLDIFLVSITVGEIVDSISNINGLGTGWIITQVCIIFFIFVRRHWLNNSR